MFKYLLLKTIYDVSDVDIVERYLCDMSFKYFLEMTPEEGVINPGSLTKFRKLRLKDTDLLNLLIGKTVSIAIKQRTHHSSGSKTEERIITAAVATSGEKGDGSELPALLEASQENGIEAKNSELKNIHGYGRASSYGIDNMQMQGAMAIYTVNLKRIFKLLN